MLYVKNSHDGKIEDFEYPMFATISKEEMQANVECDFATLKTMLELEKTMEVVVVKRPIGRPRKTIDALVFFTTNVG